MDPAIDLTGIDLTRPSVARAYDYYLGGFHNFLADRELAEATIATFPQVRGAGRSARRFLTRAVTHLAADHGVRQFLDLGSGIPTAGNVHEIAQAVDPTARVVYVDIHPVAVAHGGMLLAGNPNAISVAADLLRHYREALGPGGWIALSHATSEFQPATVQAAMQHYRRTATPGRPRDAAEVTALLDGYDLVLPDWCCPSSGSPAPCARWPTRRSSRSGSAPAAPADGPGRRPARSRTEPAVRPSGRVDAAAAPPGP